MSLLTTPSRPLGRSRRIPESGLGNGGGPCSEHLHEIIAGERVPCKHVIEHATQGKRSARWSTAWGRCNCSGAMYARVPTRTPSLVIVDKFVSRTAGQAEIQNLRAGIFTEHHIGLASNRGESPFWWR